MLNKIKEKKYWVASLLLIAVLIWVGIIFLGDSKYADEGDHARQISRFMKGNYNVMSQITTIPGYHAVIAFIAKVLGHSFSQQLRLISLAVSLFSIWIFYLLAKKLQAENPSVKMLQFVFLPITFFYFPFLYTDIFSLLLILIAFYFTISKKHSWAALFCLASLLVRQNNIIWVAFFAAYGFVADNGFSFSFKKALEFVRKGYGYFVVVILFLLFVWLNGGVSIGDRERQQVGFYLGNIYFFLVLIGVLFLPVTLAAVGKINKIIFRKRVIFGILAGLVVAGLFWFFPPQIHEYNLKLKFLRNIILSFGYGQYVLAYAAAIFWGCLSLSLLEFEKKAFLLIPFTVAALVPSLLVEQRYMIVPVVLMLLLRKEKSLKVEYGLVAYFFMLSAGLVYMLLKIEIFF